MKILKFTMEKQEQSQWCWAAVAVSTAHFYGKNQWTQCGLVNAALHYNNCCAKPCPSPCNKQYFLDDVLIRVGHLHQVRAGAVNFGRIQSELDSEHPLCARIGWSGGGGHFVTIMGYQENVHQDRFLHVEDPVTGRSTIPLEVFITRYQNHGSWTHSYFTR